MRYPIRAWNALPTASFSNRRMPSEMKVRSTLMRSDVISLLKWEPFHLAIESLKNCMILRVPFVESLNSNKVSNLHGWAESVVKSSVGVNLGFPSFLDLVSPQTWRMTGVVRFMTCNRHNLEISGTLKIHARSFQRFLDFKFVEFVVFFQNTWMWVNKFGFTY